MRSCNLCKKFIGFGAHWLAGKCSNHSEISLWDYSKLAEACPDYITDFVSVCNNCMKGIRDCTIKGDFVSVCSEQIPLDYIPEISPIFDENGEIL